MAFRAIVLSCPECGRRLSAPIPEGRTDLCPLVLSCFGVFVGPHRPRLSQNPKACVQVCVFRSGGKPIVAAAL